MASDDKAAGNPSGQIQETVKELETYAAKLNHFGLAVSATPESMALFAKLLAQLGKEASATAERNLRIATITL